MPKRKLSESIPAMCSFCEQKSNMYGKIDHLPFCIYKHFDGHISKKGGKTYKVKNKNKKSKKKENIKSFFYLEK